MPKWEMKAVGSVNPEDKIILDTLAEGWEPFQVMTMKVSTNPLMVNKLTEMPVFFFRRQVVADGNDST